MASGSALDFYDHEDHNQRYYRRKVREMAEEMKALVSGPQIDSTQMDLIEAKFQQLTKVFQDLQLCDQAVIAKVTSNIVLNAEKDLCMEFAANYNLAMAQYNRTRAQFYGERHTSILPVLKLKKFSGNILKYPNFRDCFEHAINKRTDLSKIEKFLYLKSLLDGEAEELVEYLTLTEDNYDIALKLLDKRYGDPEYMNSFCTLTLTRLQPIESLGDLEGLIKLSNRIRYCVPTLLAAGNRSAHLLMLVECSLPEEIVIGLRPRYEHDRRIECLLEVLEQIIHSIRIARMPNLVKFSNQKR